MRIISKASNTLIIHVLLPSSYALVQPTNIAWLGSDNMWVWEVDDEVEPIALFIIIPLGVTTTLCLGLLCYARRRGLGE